MAVMIDMKMPKNCGVCTFLGAPILSPEKTQCRPDWCPLHEIDQNANNMGVLLDDGDSIEDRSFDCLMDWHIWHSTADLREAAHT